MIMKINSLFLWDLAKTVLEKNLYLSANIRKEKRKAVMT